MTVLAATSALKEVLVHLNNRTSLASATVGVYLVVALEIEAGVSLQACQQCMLGCVHALVRVCRQCVRALLEW